MIHIKHKKSHRQQKKISFFKKRLARLSDASLSKEKRSFNLGRRLASNGKLRTIQEFCNQPEFQFNNINDIFFSLDSFVKDTLSKREYIVNTLNHIYQSLPPYDKNAFAKRFSQTESAEKSIRKIMVYAKRTNFFYPKIRAIENELTIYRKHIPYISFNRDTKLFESGHKHIEIRTMLKWFYNEFKDAITTYQKKYEVPSLLWVKLKDMTSVLRNEFSAKIHELRNSLCVFKAVDKFCITLLKYVFEVKYPLLTYPSSKLRKNSKRGCEQPYYHYNYSHT